MVLSACRKAGLLPRSASAKTASHRAYYAKQTSRTDRLVHAMRNVIMIQANSLHEEDGGTSLRMRALERRLREHLPPSVQLLSAMRSRPSLSPQREAVERSYDYFVPLAMLMPDAHRAASD